MNRSSSKFLSFLLAGVIVVSTFIACGKEEKKLNTETSNKEKTENSSIETPLVIGESNFSEKFSLFFVDSLPDQKIVEMTGIYLVNTDRSGALIENGIEGETRNYNGTDYTYYGIADMDITIDEAVNETIYHFKLREDITFSDGTPLTADDVIFTYYVMADPSYDGSATLYSTPIKGMQAYHSNNTIEEVSHIEGIQKLGKYEFQVITTGYDAKAAYSIANIMVAPLHYYGDTSLYDYENDQFGFIKGNLASIHEKDTVPLGAGPYKFIKYENKIVYLEANENYYLGTPKIQYVQWKETADTDNIPAVWQGTIDIATPSASKEALKQISQINLNGELNGETILTRFMDYRGYGYIGINADRICVDGKRNSDESTYLRYALAIIISVYRDVTIDTYYGDSAIVINYPISCTSWAAPKETDVGYQSAFSIDINGKPIYTEGMSAEEKYAAASKAALEYLKAAGYTIANGKVTEAPKGAKTEFEVWIGADGTGSHPSFGLLTDAKAALDCIGITLTINDLTDTSQLWSGLDAGTVDMWCAAWHADYDPDMYQIYHSANIPEQGGTDSNNYHIADEKLDELILTARTSSDQSYRKAVYKQCFDIVMDWAVEIPVYQRQDCIIFSAERINADTITPDITSFYSWYREIEKMEMNKAGV